MHARWQSEISQLRAQLRETDEVFRSLETQSSEMEAEMASMRAVIDRQVRWGKGRGVGGGYDSTRVN
jgi:predicted  nucleic acid-binding Zn-ribbon protein